MKEEKRTETQLPEHEVSPDDVAAELEKLLGEPLFAVFIEKVELTRWQRIHNHAVRMVRAPFEAVSRLLARLQIEDTKTTCRWRGDE